MFFSKFQKRKLEEEVRVLHARIQDIDMKLNALAIHQGLVIQHVWNAPKFVVLKKEESKSPGVSGSCVAAPFSL